MDGARGKNHNDKATHLMAHQNENLLEIIQGKDYEDKEDDWQILTIASNDNEGKIL